MTTVFTEDWRLFSLPRRVLRAHCVIKTRSSSVTNHWCRPDSVLPDNQPIRKSHTYVSIKCRNLSWQTASFKLETRCGTVAFSAIANAVRRRTTVRLSWHCGVFVSGMGFCHWYPIRCSSKEGRTGNLFSFNQSVRW